MSETIELDRFRSRYVPQSPQQQDLTKEIQSAADELYLLYQQAEKYDAIRADQAKKSLEMSVSWCLRGITGVREKA